MCYVLLMHKHVPQMKRLNDNKKIIDNTTYVCQVLLCNECICKKQSKYVGINSTATAPPIFIPD